MPGCRAPLRRTRAGSPSARSGTRGCSARRRPPRGGSRRSASAPGRPRGARAAAGEDFAVALHGCLLLGAVAVPIDPRLPDGASARARAATCAVARRTARSTGDEDPAAVLRDTHDLDAPAVVVHTSGTSAGARAGRR